jgi:hypothetical protein
MSLTRFSKGVKRPVQLCSICDKYRVRRGYKWCSVCSKKMNRRLDSYG